MFLKTSEIWEWKDSHQALWDCHHYAWVSLPSLAHVVLIAVLARPWSWILHELAVTLADIYSSTASSF